MAAAAAAAVGCAPEHVLVASTGVIGVALDLDEDPSGGRRREASLDRGAAGSAAAMRAIMTTDPFPKSLAVAADTRRRHDHRRRHGEGLRHDRAAHGDDARRI